MIKRLGIRLLFLFFCLLLLQNGCFAQEADGIIFSKEDRVLILAPHPDDEAIGTGGIIQKALQAKAHVKIACLTNGDNNELAFIVYEKRLTFRKGEFLHMGEVRAKETIKAMEFLGVPREDIIFLGYPDFGTMRILTEYWGKTKPYQSWLTRVSKVSYPDAMTIGAPYVGESIVADIKKVLSDFKPTKIFVSHPADVNRDHRALYVYLKVSLLDLEGLVPKSSVYPYLVHAIRWPMPRGRHPDLEMNPPANFAESGISWQKVFFIEEEIETKYEAIKKYRSQIPYAPSYLISFAKKNEFFGDFPEVVLKNRGLGEIEWQDFAATESISDEEENGQEEMLQYMRPLFSSIAFAVQGEDLWVKLTLKKNMVKNLGLVIYLFGYNKAKDFGQMPKIQIPINLLGIHLKDKKQNLSVKKRIKYIREGKVFTLKVPLSLLGSPDYIFTYVRAHGPSLPIESTAWRVLKID
ncbi:MAG TPA: PIG-L family deacetylase [Candidatus Omnitrophota bacterium]|nr:PIG-L family deacetylase [Candidatus Omnitrophota bacterium]